MINQEAKEIRANLVMEVGKCEVCGSRKIEYLCGHEIVRCGLRKFVFTLKANQRITHFRRLADVDEDVRDFLRLGATLGDRFGCVLFQCPPSLHYDRPLIEAFVGYLPPPGPGVPRFAMEFRHPSWREARELLLAQGVAWCVAETDEQDPAPEDLSWEPCGYLRGSSRT